MSNNIILERPKTTFHRTFALKRQPLSNICLFSNETSEKISKKNLQKFLNMGSIYAEAYPRYCSATGLLDKKKDSLTSFGKKVVRHDPTLSNLSSQWLLHYHMSSPNGPGPEFWHQLVKTYFIPGKNFNFDDVKEKIAFQYWESTGNILDGKAIISTSQIFLSSYLEFDGLGKLNLIKKITNNDYLTNSQKLSDSLVLAYALDHFWDSVYPDNNTVSLEKLLESDLPKIFLLTKEEFETMLNELRADGFLDIRKTAQPYQVYRKFGRDYALNKLYGPE
jgi:hypothetical protein